MKKVTPIMNAFKNKHLLALKIIKLPNYKRRDFDCSSDEEFIGWIKTLDLRDAQDIYSDMNQDWETEYDDDGCGMSHRDQCNADRIDYINERLENGEIDDIQAAELRMGA